VSPKTFHLEVRPALDPATAASPAGRLLTAASVASRLLQLAKVSTWHELGRDLSAAPGHVLLTPEQAAAVAQFDEHLHLLFQPTADDARPAIYLQVCLACGGWSLVSNPKGKTATSKRCTLRSGCPGPMTKAAAATARKPYAVTAPPAAGDAA